MLEPGTRLGPYEILAPLGAGGMGEVYRARDGRLDREVALKVLPEAVTKDAARLERFTREARTLAALNHPHIVTIFSTEEAGGLRFFTMELVEGQVLDALIPSGGVPLPRFLELALPIADALTAAHQKGITHRDLKPGNVMVSSDGRVKVLDFGLARVENRDADRSIDATRAVLTQEGAIVGTMPYMSPEQVEGRELDQRSDLFSLGAMFYEMLSGVRPFQSESSALLMSAILRDQPPELAERRTDLPDAIVRLVGRCLEKRPEDRIQTARDVYNELRYVQKQFSSSGPSRTAISSESTGRGADSFWVAVLPFTTRGADADADAMAAGLTEDITAGLTRFPSLSVVALQSARSFKDSTLDIRQIAERLRARYVIGGSVRKSSTAFRVSAHLVDATTGAHLWSDAYDRALAGADVYAIQDDVTDRIVAVVADKYGVLSRSMVQAVRSLPIHALGGRQLALRAWSFQFRPWAAEHAELRSAFEAYLEEHPDDPHVWAELAHLYIVEHSLLFNPLPDSLGRAQRAARCAIELDSNHQQGWETLAIACFHLHDDHGVLDAADRAIAANPRNANTIAWMGAILGHKGEYDRGCALVERAAALNPAHPGWYHFTPFNRHFARREFSAALEAARRVNIRDFMWMHFAIAAAAGHLGLAGEGAAAAQTMAALAPPLADEANLREFVSRWYWDPDMIELLLDGMRKAKAAAPATAARSPASASSVERMPASSAARSVPDASSASASVGGRPAAGLRVAVLPFTARSGDEESAALADGLTDDVTTGLSRFAHLRVVSRATIQRVKGLSAEMHTASAQLEARYLLEGTVRTSGTTVRITVRLVDAETGANLWAEHYDRTLAAGAFAIQDDVASRVVILVADPSGVLVRSILASLVGKPSDTMSVAELTIRYFSHLGQFNPEQHATLRSDFEHALARDPHDATGWACLSDLYAQEHMLGLNPRPQAVGRQRGAAERAIGIDPTCQPGWASLAAAQLFSGDIAAFRQTAERAIALNPLNTHAVTFLAAGIAFSGDWERGVALNQKAMTLNPHLPGHVRVVPTLDHYRRGDDEAALLEAKKINMPQLPMCHLAIAASAGQLNRVDEARAALTALRGLNPALLDPGNARAAWAKLIQDGTVVDRLVEGLEKALAMQQSG